MKKIKMLCVTTATCLAATTLPLIALTSCGGGDKPATPDIDIKQNDNVKIDCKEIIVGQEATISYNLDTGFALDIQKSSITFADSNKIIYLIQCDVDQVAKTIKVPANFVTSTKVTIDIKAEANVATEVNNSQYQAAWKYLETISEDRQFTADMKGVTTGREFVDNATATIKAKGTTEQCDSILVPTDNEIVFEQKYYSEAYNSSEKSNFWTYQYLKEGTEENKAWAPTADTVSMWWFAAMIEQFDVAILDKMSFDTLFNVYHKKSPRVVESDTYDMWIKFNTNKKIAGILFSIDSTRGDPVVAVVNFDYQTTPTFTPPEIESKTGNQYIYTTDKFTTIENGLQCDAHSTSGQGRFEIPFTSPKAFDVSKEITISGLGSTEVLNIFDGTKFLKIDDDYEISNNIITIKPNKITSGCQTLVVCNLSSGPSSRCQETTVTITQE